MGNRLLLPLNILNKKNAISNPDKERKTRLRLRYAYIDCDSITYHLPEGYSLEFTPSPVEIKSEFGTYSNKTILSDDKKSVLYIRILNRNDGYYPPEKFKDYVSFVNLISRQDNIKVSLIKVQ